MSKQNNNVFYSMKLRDIFSENFLRLYVDCNKLSDFKKLDTLDKTLFDLTKEEIETIENLLGFQFEFLKDRAINYIIIRKMNDLDML